MEPGNDRDSSKGPEVVTKRLDEIISDTASENKSQRRPGEEEDEEDENEPEDFFYRKHCLTPRKKASHANINKSSEARIYIAYVRMDIKPPRTHASQFRI